VLGVLFFENMWEEIGWRGYALPTLQKKYNALYSSIIVGAFWAMWHWLHFFVKDSVMMTNYHNFLWFTISVILDSVIYTWLYNSTKGSLTIVSLYHSSFNAFGLLLFINQGVSYIVFPYLMAIYFLLVAVIIVVLRQENLSHTNRVTFNTLL